MAEDQRKPSETTETTTEAVGADVQPADEPQRGDGGAAAPAAPAEDAVQDEEAPAQEEDQETLLEQAVETAKDLAESATEAVSSAAGAVTRLIEEAVEAVSEKLDFPSGEESGDASRHDIPLTSVDSAGDLKHTGGSLGFTGEITGRVVKLSELETLRIESEASEEYDQLRSLIEQTLTNVSEHEIVKGRVVSVGEKDIVIDIGFKSDGIVSKNEFSRDLAPGDEVEVYLERIEDMQGQLVLSKTKADTVRRWQRIEDAYDNEKVLEGTIVRRIKGGMIVELFENMEAFLPGSQIDVRPVRDFDAYLDKRMEFKIVKLNPANENIVVSHKALIEKELESQRQKILASMEPGQVLEGTVKNITDFGVFIDLGGVDGLLHITDLSWGRVSHPSELVSLDDKLNVVVLDYDKNRQRISLGLKQLQPHPWENINEKYVEGSVVEGKVVSITDYGAFVELEKGIEGLVHISEMSWTEHIRHPSQMVALGQLVNVKILNVDHEGKKISLGMKQLQPDPWEGISDRYPPGTPLSGKVRNITNFGVFVEIEPGIDGLVHISDLSWTKRVRHPSEMVKKGQEMNVVILNIDEKERRISLGHKQVETNPWNQFAKVYAEGTDTEATVSRVEDKGLVVDLPMDVEAFVPSAELKNGGQNFQEFYREGAKLEMRVIRFDANNKEIILSEVAKQRAEERAEREAEQREKRVVRDRERREISEFQERSGSATGPTTLGELSGLASLRDQLARAEQQRTAPAEAAEAPAPSAEEAQAALKGTGAADEPEAAAEAAPAPEAVEESPAAAEAGDAHETPTGEVGEKPQATVETVQSVEEVESFTKPTGEERMVTTEDVAPPEAETEETTAAAEMGEASAEVEASSPEEAEDVADKAAEK